MQKGVIKIKNQLTEQEAEKVSQALESVWGVRRTEVHAASREASFTYNEEAASYTDFQQAITDLGFEVEPNV
ncbi:heavy-metal-associated domain-containing protein [Pseudobacillus badius]|uniref:heavy-metal-associated domain-containing protein n=1 Tax=Bacillus badius TaxID=1455 RepID=UPI0007B05C51|nr:heavy metal-associated domain-containing protein [Bacillus badius]KZO00351.1 hypothetical protein A4244_05550 [Bacillus badius]OCS86518.1 hypothetical protein A6M11_05555 [Bacillus badius]OVE52018.1 hypothetical protein B1A98_06300 [Bacillus badius]TDW03716.1 copper chaperone CopZ [Bacillus badius]